ncbi:MAG TPA: hypothetical protein ENH20_01155 [Candidatus Pacearchaeota archaeon]|nr:hypothetical protein [Candidatus Pacearchaeota archaeon]
MIESNKKSLAGEFYVMHRFFLKGYEATLTLGNTKGIDILVYNSKNNKQFKVEVKTTEMITNGKVFGKNMDWFMGKKHEDMEDDSLIYCFVFLSEDENKKPRIFIVPSKEVAQYCKESHQKWLNVEREKPVKDTDMRSFRILVGEKSSYEDNFLLFE